MSRFFSLAAAFACVVTICGVFFSIAAAADQTEYYFDYVNGSDENDGTKAATSLSTASISTMARRPHRG